MPYQGSSCQIDKCRRITVSELLLKKSNLKNSGSIAFVLHDENKRIIKIVKEESITESDKILDFRKFDGRRFTIPLACMKILGCKTGDTIALYLQGKSIFLQGIQIK